jgi:pimeloyl-ACP methyl ester carboxylesterase
MAKAFAALMSRLGYQRWGASGGDTGALVGKELGILAPDGLIGIHLLQIFAYPSGDPGEMAKLSEADTKSLSGSTADFQSKAGYQAIQRTRPQTLGYGLTDSPVGQLAWNAELWTGWGDYADYLDVDTYLTHLSIYWFTRTGSSSARHYYEDAQSGAGYRDAPNKVATALAVFPQDFRTIRAFAERNNNIVRYTEFDRGGHFAYTTDPDLAVDDLREFFASPSRSTQVTPRTSTNTMSTASHVRQRTTVPWSEW